MEEPNTNTLHQVAIRVNNVSKSFKLPHEKHGSFKSLAVNSLRRKKYSQQKALKGINFEVNQGEFFGIVGRNGSGKSTLLKLLAGIYTPDQGHVTVNGSLTPFIELGVGFNPELTGRENVFLNGALLGFSRKEMEAQYDDIVSFAELKRFMDQKLKNYSSGMQVRLAFSIAIRAQGDILLLDEVLAVGDAAFQQKCYNYFENLKVQHKTVVFVSHDMGAVRRFCNKAAYISGGKLIQIGTAQEIADMYIEENIDKGKPDPEKPSAMVSNKYRVSTTIVRKPESLLHIKCKFVSNTRVPVYVGLAVVKDGMSIAEINTARLKLPSKGSVSYTLNTDLLNGGIYELKVALFNLNNRELLTVGKSHPFALKGSDQFRGAALKLPDNWQL